jgi:hypothetical protein
VTAQNADTQWSGLVDSPAEEREAAMRERYLELAALDEDTRRERLKAMADAEYAIPDDKLRVFSLSRLRTWLALPDDAAQAVAHSYDAVMQRMPGPIAMRRVSIVQTLAAAFSPEDEERLRALVPGVFAGVPSRTRVVGDVAVALELPSQVGSPASSSLAPARRGASTWRRGK